MRTAIITIVSLLVIAFVFVIFINKPTTKKVADNIISDEIINNMNTLKLTSLAFENNEKIPSIYTCDGENINPPLSISGVPEGTQSFTLIMEDPDVPTSIRADGIWDHWIVFNISPTTTDIKEGEEPNGIHGIGTSDNTEYNGPCPPDREHRYFFKLYALDVELNLEEGPTKKEVEKAMQGHIIDKAELVGLYERKG